MSCDHPRPGKVLYLDDPYCWYSQDDVRPYFNRPAYAVQAPPCPTCEAERTGLTPEPGEKRP